MVAAKSCGTHGCSYGSGGNVAPKADTGVVGLSGARGKVGPKPSATREKKKTLTMPSYIGNFFRRRRETPAFKITLL